VTVQIELTEEQADTLRGAIETLLGDLGPEIAATDNAGYRRGLREHRQSLSEVLAKLPRDLGV